nr:N-acetylmuramoyl-L-alanine amidase [Corynebacterium aquilae]
MFTRHRRRLAGTTRRPVAATLAVTALAAAAGVSYVATTPEPTNTFVVTDGEDVAPVDATIEQTSFADGASVVVDDPAIVSQGEAPGPKAVREFTRENPFSMFALTWTSDHDIAAFFRAQQADGSWSPWYDAETLSEKESTTTQGTEPIYVAPTTRIQVSTTGVDAAEPPADLNAVFIDGNEQAGPEIELTADSDGLTRVVSRKGWGANESLRCQNPTIDDGVSAITIHHTAGSNDYTKSQAKSIMRGIYQYHAQTLGWCDVGYNALVDKWGTIYEGRAGGLNRAVQGAHAGGFNENTWGISMMGDYSTVQPSAATIKAVGELAGWRAYVAGFDPTGYDTHISEGTRYTKYPQGTSVTLPNIFAHRDVGLTTCPGDAGYSHMGEIRQIAKKKFDALSAGTDVSTPGNSVTTPPTTSDSTSPGTKDLTTVTPDTPGGTKDDELNDSALSKVVGSSVSASSEDNAPAATNTGTGNTEADLKDMVDTLKTAIDAAQRIEEATRPYRQ